MNNLRCIVGARVSVLNGPQKVSHLAQIETGARWVAQNDGTVVGTFEDLGVSASIEPEKRPDLGPWLTDPEKIDEWDAVVWSKMDRAFRSTRHCVDFAKWAEDNKKIVVFAEDGLTLNYRDPSKGIDAMLSELFVYLGSFFAQMELARFQQRARDSHRMLRPTTRWASGAPPFGYRVIDHPSGKGKGLEKDPETQKVLHEMAQRLLNGESFTGIADWLGPPWTTTNVIEALTSPRTQGIKCRKRSGPVLDENGDVIQMADPSFDRETWDLIQQKAEERRITRRRVHTKNPVLGVAFCGQCGKSMAQQFSHGIRYYRCGRTPVNCKNSMLKSDKIDDLIEELFLDDYGDVEVTTREYVVGNQNASEIEAVNQTIARLRREQDNGLVVTPEDEEEWTRRMKAQVEKREALRAQETTESGWVYRSTGKRFKDVWADPSTVKRDVLLEHGVRLFLDSAKPFVWRIEFDVKPQGV